ncbi:hypothetical protein GGF32_006075 [Allomyces javanicus]|nr:hypothetical protein GGF32_006075 [Allomyces javanicus]
MTASVSEKAEKRSSAVGEAALEAGVAKALAAPRLSMIQGAALITGATIGSGVFSNPGKIVGLVGATGPALILWILGAVVAFAASMSYAEWGSRVTASGGDAPFLDRAYTRPRRFAAVVYSWTRVILINPGYNSSLCYIAGSYFTQAFPSLFPEETGTWNKIIATILLILQTVACVPSNNLAGRFVTATTAMSVTCLVLFSAVGLLNMFGVFSGKRNLESLNGDHFFAGASTDPSQYAMALFKALWAYDGFANLASSLGELKDPERNISRSTITGVGMVGILYLFANFSFFTTLTFEEVSTGGESIASMWAEHLFGETGRVIVALFICLTVIACSFVTLYSASRIAQATGETGLMLFPKFFAQLNGKFQTPINALAFNCVMSALMCWAPQTDDAFWVLIDVTSYPLWVWYTTTNFGLILTKWRSPGGLFAKDPTVKGVQVTPLAPILVVLVGIFLLIFPFFSGGTGPMTSGIALGVIVTGVVPYWFLIMAPERAAAASRG